MKKILAILVFSILLLGQASFVLAAGTGEICDACCSGTCKAGLECVGAGSPCDFAQKKNVGQCQEPGKVTLCPFSTHTSIADLVDAVTTYVFYIAVIVAPLMILIGAFVFLTSAGDPGRTALGKKIIIWAVIGLAIILFAKGIMSIVTHILTG